MVSNSMTEHCQLHEAICGWHIIYTTMAQNVLQYGLIGPPPVGKSGILKVTCNYCLDMVEIGVPVTALFQRADKQLILWVFIELGHHFCLGMENSSICV